MLSEAKIIALYCIVDDILKNMRHYEDRKVQVNDSEVITTTSFIYMLYFGWHLDNARHLMQLKGYDTNMLSKSRFCRRLHRLADCSLTLFYAINKHLKDLVCAADYRLDSFLVAVCDNVRISRSRLLTGEAFRGRHTAMRRYFYGVRFQVLMLNGVTVEFWLVPGFEHDSQALSKLPFAVVQQSCIYMDAGYTDYGSEEDTWEAEGIVAMVHRKKNSKRPDAPHINFLKEHMRKGIETDFSLLKAKMLRSIHAVTQQGFLLKVALFVIASVFDRVADLYY